MQSETPPSTVQSPGRRRLLQALAAGGALALTGLPARWSPPRLAVGLLPAHAQSSALTLSNLTSQLEQTPCPTTDGATGQVVTMNLQYVHPFGRILPGSVVRQRYVFSPSGNSGSNQKPLTAAEIDAPTAGVIRYQNCVAFAGSDTELQLILTLVDAAGNESNSISTVVTTANSVAGQSAVTPR